MDLRDNNESEIRNEGENDDDISLHCSVSLKNENKIISQINRLNLSSSINRQEPGLFGQIKP